MIINLSRLWLFLTFYAVVSNVNNDLTQPEPASKTATMASGLCSTERLLLGPSHYISAINFHQFTEKGYSFTTSVSIRRFPGLGDDIFATILV